MSFQGCVLRMIPLPDTNYFHREYGRDIPGSENKDSWLTLGKRVAVTALPFVSLYKPAHTPLALTLGGLRIVNSVDQFILSCTRADRTRVDVAISAANIVVAVSALAATFFDHTTGTLITTAQDILNDLNIVINFLQYGNYELASYFALRIVNNALYLALTAAGGGLELAIASLAMQMLVSALDSFVEYKQNHMVESVAYLAMAAIRGYQAQDYAGTLRLKWRIEEFFHNRPHTSQIATIDGFSCSSSSA